MPGSSPISMPAFSKIPASVDESWRRFFAEIGEDGAAALAELRAPIWGKPPARPTGKARRAADCRRGGAAPGDLRLDPRVAADPRLSRARPSRSRSRPARPRQARALSRARLPQLRVRRGRSRPRDLSQRHFGRERASLREIIAILRQTYCGTIGVEYMHIQVPAERAWIQQKFEKRQRRPVLSAADKKGDPARS